MKLIKENDSQITLSVTFLIVSYTHVKGYGKQSNDNVIYSKCFNCIQQRAYLFKFAIN